MKTVARLFAVSLAMCGYGAVALAQTAADAVAVRDAYVRPPPPGVPNGVAFMTLRNESDVDQLLVGAESSAARVTEIHTHIPAQGMMRMRRVEQILVPAKDTVSLESGGLHLMMIGLYRHLQPGERAGIRLIFADGSAIHLDAPVRELEIPGQDGMTKPHDRHMGADEKTTE